MPKNPEGTSERPAPRGPCPWWDWAVVGRGATRKREGDDAAPWSEE